MVHEDDPTVADDTSDTIEDGSPGDGLAPPHQIVIHTTEAGLPAPGAKVGRYELVEVIGKGGMGVVFRARDPELDRSLAIKVVLPATDSKRAQQRLLDEARAMAKLRHPSVVPVFDVGTTERGVYIVMPLLGGGTLRSWAESEPRSWREVLERYLAAGRGLAAAHNAGLVHRDFKPGNVLLGDAGEVMVGDFGLAADTDTPSPFQNAITPSPLAHVPTTVGGTPAYMAPEHASGAPVDARADQFSFCISLWEGLHGERPTEAATRAGGAVSAALPAVPADRRGAPRWLLTAVARGWQAAPERRWPSMTALLDHIEGRLRRPRRLAIASGVLVVAGAGALAAQMVGADRAPPCPDPQARLAGVWGPDVHQAVEQAFERAAPGLGRDAATRIRPILDGYAERWRTSSISACKDTRAAGTQTEDMLERRQLCLDRRIGALSALTAVFRENPDRTVVIRAIDAANNLPDVADCDRKESLLALQPMPGAPAQRAAIADLQRELDAIAALTATGRLEDQLRRAEAAVAKARTVDYQPLLARALLMLTRSQIDSGKQDDATFQELARIAAAANDDATVARALISLVEWKAIQTKPDEAAALEPAAEAALIRAGSTADLRYRYETAVGLRLSRGRQYEAALARYQAALSSAVEPAQRALAEANIARTTLQAKGFVAARPLAEKALASMESTYGPGHPSTGAALEVMSQGLVTIGEYEQAEALALRTLGLYESVFGPTHARLAPVLHTLTFIAKVTGRLPAARDYGERAVRIAEASNNPTRLANILAGHAEVVHKVDGLAAARTHFQRALDVYVQGAGKQDPGYAQLANTYASALVDAEDCETAEPIIDEALAILTVKRPDLTPQPLHLKARCLHRRKQWPDAIRMFEQVEELCRVKYACEPIIEYPNLANLAVAMLESRRDRARALVLFRRAKDGYAAKKLTGHAEELDGYLSKNHIRL